MRRLRAVPALAALGAFFPVAPALAQIEDSIVVTATRSERRSLDIPGSIDAVGGETLREGQPKVNLSEAMGGVPGLVLQNRGNYAQDLQMSIRGFGARSTFGIRGIKLYADGIPSSMADGSGQVANFNLSTAGRVEVMRGPLAALYGNASGGVVNLFTADGPKRPTISGELLLGDYGTRRYDGQFGGESGPLNFIGDWSQFHTDGYRNHSAVNRQMFNSKFKWQASDDTRATVVLNTIYQPDTQDPLGLTAAQASANPRQVDRTALLFNTKKTIRQEQTGITLEHRVDASNNLRAIAYAGDRQVRQFLATAVPVPLTNYSGGVVELSTFFGGVGLHWIHDGKLLGRPLAITTGLERDLMQQRRRGFDNNSGSMGLLRRDEDDPVTATNLFGQADWRFTERASATVGIRRTLVKYESRDHYVTAANPDDSGSIAFANTSPVAGFTYRVAPEIAVYASAGRGFETPTFAELAYRNGATGLNFALKPTRSTNAEVGIKGRVGDYQKFTLARFDTTTRDEIVNDVSVGGRAFFKNAGRTRRTGWEGSWQAVLPAGFDARAAYTAVDARYKETFTSGAASLLVPIDNKLAGVPRTSLYAELQWRHFQSGFATALEMRHNSRIYVDDQNSDSAPAYTIANLRLGFEQKSGDWRVAETLRIDNLTDKTYIGSVIVAQAAGQFFEPAPRRNLSFLVSARRAF